MTEQAQLRIGELARRTGVATELLRAWERRYGLLSPVRTQAGYRLYSDADVDRVRPDAGAARERGSQRPRRPGRRWLETPRGGAGRARAGGGRGRAAPSARAARRRRRARRVRPAARRLLARRPCWPASSSRSCTSSGAGWERGDDLASRRSTSRRTFSAAGCSGSLAAGTAAPARAPCSRARPGERHDLGLVIFGLALREHGWRITFLGADTPAGHARRDGGAARAGRARVRRRRLGAARSASADDCRPSTARRPRSGSAAPGPGSSRAPRVCSRGRRSRRRHRSPA